jgi:hypothetical protein
MKKVSRFFLLGALILVLLTTACGAEEGTVTPSYPGVDDLALTSTPSDGVETTEPVATAHGAETATGDINTPDITVLETATQDASTATPGIPVTGVDVILIECQFCVDTWAHALLVLPDTASFEVVSPPPTTSTTSQANEAGCSTVEVNNGKQVVLCSGPEMTPLTLNICTDVNTCTDFPVDLFSCPDAPGSSQLQSTPGTEGTDSTSTPPVVISTATSSDITPTATTP